MDIKIKDNDEVTAEELEKIENELKALFPHPKPSMERAKGIKEMIEMELGPRTMEYAEHAVLPGAIEVASSIFDTIGLLGKKQNEKNAKDENDPDQ